MHHTMPLMIAVSNLRDLDLMRLVYQQAVASPLARTIMREIVTFLNLARSVVSWSVGVTIIPPFLDGLVAQIVLGACAARYIGCLTSF